MDTTNGTKMGTTPAWKFLGNTDEVDTCDCCGRTGLKSTVALESNADGSQVNFGVTCAARALKWGVKEVKAAAKSADEAKAAEKRAAMMAEAQASYDAWIAFLLTKPFVKRDHVGRVDIAATGEAAGGIMNLRNEFYTARASEGR